MSEAKKVGDSLGKNAGDEQADSNPGASRIVGKQADDITKILLRALPGSVTGVDPAKGTRSEHAAELASEPGNEYDAEQFAHGADRVEDPDEDVHGGSYRRVRSGEHE